jgi:hypothetical protein
MLQMPAEPQSPILPVCPLLPRTLIPESQPDLSQFAGSSGANGALKNPTPSTDQGPVRCKVWRRRNIAIMLPATLSQVGNFGTLNSTFMFSVYNEENYCIIGGYSRMSTR